jgi:hypothetical protein
VSLLKTRTPSRSAQGAYLLSSYHPTQLPRKRADVRLRRIVDAIDNQAALTETCAACRHPQRSALEAALRRGKALR